MKTRGIRNTDEDALRRSLAKHSDRLRRLPAREQPEPGELAEASLEEEFEDQAITS
ncbi:MAG: hypothetical protein F7B95_01760 [Desulfurococcales archaeon]|nr:hypothetical protein [Desulfurococcales archaeon]